MGGGLLLSPGEYSALHFAQRQTCPLLARYPKNQRPVAAACDPAGCLCLPDCWSQCWLAGSGLHIKKSLKEWWCRRVCQAIPRHKARSGQKVVKQSGSTQGRQVSCVLKHVNHTHQHSVHHCPSVAASCLSGHPADLHLLQRCHQQHYWSPPSWNCQCSAGTDMFMGTGMQEAARRHV